MTTQLLVNVIATYFAAYALCYAVIEQEGPASIFQKLRDYVGVYEVSPINPTKTADTNFGRLFTCPYCLSWYIVPLLYFPTVSIDLFFNYITIPLAIIGFMVWVPTRGRY